MTRLCSFSCARRPTAGAAFRCVGRVTEGIAIVGLRVRQSRAVCRSGSAVAAIKPATRGGATIGIAGVDIGREDDS